MNLRSLLFVPGDSDRKLEKSLQSGADAVIVDLEDSVAPAAKPAAREIARDFVAAHRDTANCRLLVRVNDLGSGEIDGDLAAVMVSRPHGIMLPKCGSAADLEHLSAKLRVHEALNGMDEGATEIIPLITETASSVLAAATYRPHARLAALTWGAEDLSAAIGAHASRDETGALTDLFRLARSLTLLAASAAETAAVDTVFTDFRDEAALRRECLAAERDGFTAKLAIHPAQVPVINDAFTPSVEAVERSAAIAEAFRAAGNPGVVSIGGKMYDRPHLRLAERLLARAGRRR